MSVTVERQVAVLGAGSFGTALANLIASNGYRVTLWGRDADTLRSISSTGENQRYLPGVALSDSMRCRADLQDALGDASDILVAIPSQHFNNIIEKIEAYAPSSSAVLWACKGLEPKTGRFLSEVVEQRLGSNRDYAVISGPTFAQELAAHLPTAIVVAANRAGYAASVTELLHNDRFRAYASNDIRGVQLGGAFKNIYAIAAGISDGLEFGANARVAVITRGLAELMRLGECLGVQSETLMGLSGVGDLILTCTDNQSRNRRFGLALGEGKSAADALHSIGQSVEGVVATEIAWQLAKKHDVSMPIVEQVHRVISGRVTPKDAVGALLGRSSTAE